MASIIDLKCPSCGAELHFNEQQDQYFCKYCGTKIFIDNPNERRTRLINEAQVRAVELEKEKFRYFTEENQAHEEKLAQWKKYLLYWVGAMAASFFFGFVIPDSRVSDLFAGVFVFLLFFGALTVAIIYPRKSRMLRSMEEAEPENMSSFSWVAAVILCVMFGIFGVHYFYVRRYRMGLLYLFTAGLFGIGYVFDIIRIIAGRFPDCYGKNLVAGR